MQFFAPRNSSSSAEKRLPEKQPQMEKFQLQISAGSRKLFFSEKLAQHEIGNCKITGESSFGGKKYIMLVTRMAAMTRGGFFVGIPNPTKKNPNPGDLKFHEIFSKKCGIPIPKNPRDFRKSPGFRKIPKIEKKIAKKRKIPKKS